MWKKGFILKFPIRQWFAIEDSEKAKFIELPIKIQDEESGQEITFNYFKWENDGGIMPTFKSIPILYRVEGEGDLKRLVFKVT